MLHADFLNLLPQTSSQLWSLWRNYEANAENDAFQQMDLYVANAVCGSVQYAYRSKNMLKLNM